MKKLTLVQKLGILFLVVPAVYGPAGDGFLGAFATGVCLGIGLGLLDWGAR